MGLFFTLKPAPIDDTFPVDEAFDDHLAVVDRIGDPDLKTSVVALRRRVSAFSRKPAVNAVPNWKTIVGVFILLLIVFWAAYRFEGNSAHPKTSDNLFTAFQVLFTGFLATLGLENVKH